MGTVYRRQKPVDPLRCRRGRTPGGPLVHTSHGPMSHVVGDHLPGRCRSGGPPRGQTGNRKRFLSIYVNSAIMEEIVKG